MPTQSRGHGTRGVASLSSPVYRACPAERIIGPPFTAGDPASDDAAPFTGFYVPYGHAWLPYSLSQARRHPSLFWWTVRDWLLGWRPPGTRRLAKAEP